MLQLLYKMFLKLATQLKKAYGYNADNATNYLATFDTLGWKRTSCFGHNLNLAVSEAVDNH